MQHAVKLTSSKTNKSDLGINGATFNGYGQISTIYFDPVVANSSNLEKVVAADGFININDLK